MVAMTLDLATLHALAEPNRIKIVELLREGPLSVGEIADRLQMRQPQTSKHLRVLAEAGIVEVKMDANRRIYRLRKQPFIDLEAWSKSIILLWEERFDRLDEYLQDLQRKNKKTSGGISNGKTSKDTSRR
jgi:DNA-binding transcriptional ArsR family regulator